MCILKFECKQCNESFERTKKQASGKRNIFCSIVCERKSRKKGKDIECGRCGKITYISATRLAEVNFCSRSCATIYRNKQGTTGGKKSRNMDLIDWNNCQKLHDSGVFFSNLPKETGISIKILNKAVSLNILVKKYHKYIVPKEIKNKISVGLKKAHEEGRHPGWALSNINNKSYPEKLFLIILKQYTFFDKFTMYIFIQAIK